MQVWRSSLLLRQIGSVGAHRCICEICEICEYIVQQVKDLLIPPACGPLVSRRRVGNATSMNNLRAKVAEALLLTMQEISLKSLEDGRSWNEVQQKILEDGVLPVMKKQKASCIDPAWSFLVILIEV